jgi:dihydropteroate synthase
LDKDTFFSKKRTINCRGKLIDLSSPIIMGILNVTPDSFYDGGVYTTVNKALARAESIIREGGTIIDIGAYSSRPGAADISPEEELKRLIPVIEAIRERFPDTIISIDTFRSGVAKESILAGADIINDISSGDLDPLMFKIIKELGVPYIAMHMKGDPQNMQNNPEYQDILQEIILYFSALVKELNGMGIADIILDPGFGFGKTLEHNYQILHHLEDFKLFQLPILVGISRKSMIYKLLNTNAKEALNGTTVINTIALLKGADILRVHDVKEALEVIKIVNATQPN